VTYPHNARGYDGFGGRAETTFAGSRPWWPGEPRAQAGAPNIVVVLVDDLGYSDVSPFGSEIDTPAIQASADRGVVLSNYHTGPVCSPARAALLPAMRGGHRQRVSYDPAVLVEATLRDEEFYD